MPRNVRNFWIELDVDGKKQKVATGPRNGSGGFRLRILMREEGGISDKELIVNGYANEEDNTLNLVAWKQVKGIFDGPQVSEQRIEWKEVKR